MPLFRPRSTGLLQAEAPPQRRLPVYLLLDCSASMAGAPLAAMREGVQQLVQQLRNHPLASSTVWLSIITYGTRARQVMPLTPPARCHFPKLEAGGTSSLGAAFHLFGQILERDTRPSMKLESGDWRPLLFLLTDGEPTDHWQLQIGHLKHLQQHKLGNFVIIACGDRINTANLSQLTDQIIPLVDLSGDQLHTFFRWVSQDMAPLSLSAGGDDDLPGQVRDFL